MTSPYSGDPKVIIDKNGMYFEYRNGQPVMDRGLENAAILQLLTDINWHGNQFLDQPIGSKFEETARRPITRTALSDVEKAVEAALTLPVFGDKDISVVNPESYRLDVTATIKPPGFDSGAIRVERNGENWLNQRNDPAYRRI